MRSTSGRFPPPRNKGGRIVIRSPKKMRWLTAAEVAEVTGGTELEHTGDSVGDIMEIYVGVPHQLRFGVSSSWARGPPGAISAQGWVLGRDQAAAPPACQEMMGLLHALCIARGYLKEENVLRPFRVDVWVEGESLVEGLLPWFNAGGFPFVTAGSSEVVELLKWMHDNAPCQVCVRATLDGFCDECNTEGMDPAGVIVGTVRRVAGDLLQKAGEGALARIACKPPTRKEVKEKVLTKYREDEARTIQWLAGLGSEACRVYGQLRLSRGVLEKTMAALVGNRRA